MYFINYEKCSSCKEKKSVAIFKPNKKKLCFDCDPDHYNHVALKQKEHWLNKEKK